MHTPPPGPRGADDLLPLLEAARGGRPIFESLADLNDRKKIEAAVRETVERIKLEIPRLWKQLPPQYQEIIERLAHDAKADLYELAAEWFVQRMLFLEIGKHFKLEQVERFPSTRPECVIMLTKSSSFLSAGRRDPDTGERDIEYIPIESRKARLEWDSTFRAGMSDLVVGERAGFSNELTTSQVQYILVIPLDQSHALARIVERTSQAVGSTLLPRQDRTPGGSPGGRTPRRRSS